MKKKVGDLTPIKPSDNPKITLPPNTAVAEVKKDESGNIVITTKKTTTS